MEFYNIFYVLASVLFILGIKKLSHPKTARNGNFLSALGTKMTVYSIYKAFFKYLLHKYNNKIKACCVPKFLSKETQFWD